MKSRPTLKDVTVIGILFILLLLLSGIKLLDIGEDILSTDWWDSENIDFALVTMFWALVGGGIFAVYLHRFEKSKKNDSASDKKNRSD